MKIIAQAEVSSNMFIMQNEGMQYSMDFLFVLFLHLIQYAMDVANSSKEVNINLDGATSQDAKPDYQRALDLLKNNPSLNDTFNQAITFVALLSQFVTDKADLEQDGAKENPTNPQHKTLDLAFNVENMKNLSLENQSFENLSFENLSFEKAPFRNQDNAQFKRLEFTREIVQELSSFISKAWKEYKAILKSIEKESRINPESIKEEFYTKINAEWKSLTVQSKDYLKESLANFIVNQKTMINRMNTKDNEKVYLNSENLSENNEDSSPNFVAKKIIEIERSFQVNNNSQANNEKREGNPLAQLRKEVEGDGREEKTQIELTTLFEKQNERQEISRIFQNITEKGKQNLNTKLNTKENTFLLTAQAENGQINSDTNINIADKVHPSSQATHRIALRELPDFVRNIVFEVLPQGKQKAKLELFPPELGQIEIEVRVEDGEVSVVGKLENSQAYQEILKEVPVIKNQLEELGLKVKDLTFALTTGDANIYNKGERQQKENKEGMFGKPSGRFFTQGPSKEENLINFRGRYYYIA